MDYLLHFMSVFLKGVEKERTGGGGGGGGGEGRRRDGEG